jgi:superfamily I DNA/RNA helicase
MSTRILLAPAGRGKTRYCLDRIREQQAADPLGPVWVVLPNTAQVTAFRRRLAEAGGALAVQPGTFYTFYAEILARAGQPAPRLLEPVQYRLLQTIVSRLWQAGRLTHYAPVRDRPGFVVVLRALVEELKRARIERQAFSAAVAGQGARLEELAAIYAAYQDWLVRTGWVDAEGQGWLAALALERQPDLCRDVRLLVVDGFDEFNPTQLAVLKLLAGQVDETIVTLTGDPDRSAAPVETRGLGLPRPVHRRFTRAQHAITSTLGVAPFRKGAEGPKGTEGTSVPFGPSVPSAPLSYLESSLFEPSSQVCPADGAVTCLEAQNRAEEVRAALRWLKARLVRDGMALHEVAVLARNLDPYRPFLEETAAEFGLPVWLAGGAPLATNPAIAALLSLLSLPVQDWPRRPVLDAWRSPYFDWSVLETTADGRRPTAGLEQGSRACPERSEWGAEEQGRVPLRPSAPPPPGSVGDRPEHGGSVGDRPEHGSVGDRPEHGSVGDRPEHAVGGQRSPDITARDADRLDAVSRAGLVIQGLAQWAEAFDVLASQTSEVLETSEVSADDEDLTPPEVPAGAEIAGLRRKFDAFVARISPPPAATFREYAAFVEDLIGDDPRLSPGSVGDRPEHARPGSVGDRPEHEAGTEGTMPPLSPLTPLSRLTPSSTRIVARAWEVKATALRDIAALQAFKDVLRGLVLAEAAPTLTPSTSLRAGPGPSPRGRGETFAHFFNELRSAVSGTSYQVPPPESGYLLAAPVLQARGLSFRAVALLGLAEGEFPQAEQEDALLRETDRAGLRSLDLPLEPRLRGDEITLFYEAVTRAREKLLLTRPYLADDGQMWEPSPYWEEVRRLVDAPVERVRPETPLPLAEAASPLELITILAGHGDAETRRSNLTLSPCHLVTLSPCHPVTLSDAWQSVEHGAAVLAARLAETAHGPYEGDLSALAATLAARYSADHSWSASRLEAYGTCPLYFYVGYGLDLEPRRPPQPGYDVRILGSMVHRILEEVYRRATDPTDLGQLLALLPAVAHQVFDTAPTEYGFRPSELWKQQREELEQVLHDTLTALAEVSHGYTPKFFEQVFGFRTHPVLVIPGEGGGIRLHGYIDRLDQAPDGRLRIIDYKASGSAITARDLADGRRLQLSLYALAARDALKLGDLAGGFYWHIGKAQPSSLKLEKFEGGVEAALRNAAGHALADVAAIRAGRFQPKPPDGGCPNYCPAVAFCWRYTPKGW